MRSNPHLTRFRIRRSKNFPDDSENLKDSESSEESDFDLDPKDSEDISDMDFSDEFAILKEMQEDLKEHFEREYEGEAQLGNSEAEDKRNFSSTPSYLKHLYRNTCLINLNW